TASGRGEGWFPTVEPQSKAAGGVLTAKKGTPLRPGTAPALGLRAGNGVPRMITQTASCLRGVSVMRTRTGKPRLQVELLEDRWTPSTFLVENLADGGLGSLRQAILDANAQPGADLIAFAPAARDGTVALTTGQLGITDDLTIDGPGAGRLAVSGNDASRV